MSTIDFDLKCAFCVASLNGIELEGACPLCGREVRATLDCELIDPATMVVSGDVPCIQCDYNLRTLQIRSLCPECAKPVAASLQPTGLRFADLGYLVDVRNAVGSLLVALLLSVAVFLICGISMSLIYAMGLAAGIRVPIAVFGVAGLIVMTCYGVRGVIGICQMEPGRRYSWFLRNLSQIAGTLLVVAAICFLYRLFVFRLSPVLFVCSVSCLIASMACAALRIRHLAGRARDRWLRRLSTAWMVCLGGWMILLTGITVGCWILPGRVVFVGMLLVDRAGLLVCYALSMMVLVRCRRLLTAVLKARTA